MELFHGKIQFFPANSNAPYALECGNPALKDSLFARGRYCKNNFNNFASSFIVLMELTVVNQWHDILCGGRAKPGLGEPCSPSTPSPVFPLILNALMHLVPDRAIPPTVFFFFPPSRMSLLDVLPDFLPLALLYSKTSSFGAIILNSHYTLCQWICQCDCSACKTLFHCLPHCDGYNYCQVSFWFSPLYTGMERGSDVCRGNVDGPRVMHCMFLCVQSVSWRSLLHLFLSLWGAALVLWQCVGDGVAGACLIRW